MQKSSRKSRRRLSPPHPFSLSKNFSPPLGPPMAPPRGGDPGGEIFFLTSKKGVGVRACGAFSGLIFAFLNFLLNQFLKKLPKSLKIIFKRYRAPLGTLRRPTATMGRDHLESGGSGYPGGSWDVHKSLEFKRLRPFRRPLFFNDFLGFL